MDTTTPDSDSLKGRCSTTVDTKAVANAFVGRADRPNSTLEVLSDHDDDGDNHNDKMDMDIDNDDDVDVDDDDIEEEDLFTRLEEYHESRYYNHSYQDFPFDYIQDPTIENWVTRLRDSYRKKELPTHRVDRYRLAGMALDEDDAKWFSNFNRWKDKNVSNGSSVPLVGTMESLGKNNSATHPSKTDKEVYNGEDTGYTVHIRKWVKRQRRHYKQKKLPTVRECLLRQVGFHFVSSSKRSTTKKNEVDSTTTTNLVGKSPSSSSSRGQIVAATQGTEVAASTTKQTTASSSNYTGRDSPRPHAVAEEVVRTDDGGTVEDDHDVKDKKSASSRLVMSSSSTRAPVPNPVSHPTKELEPSPLPHSWNYYFQQLKEYKEQYCNVGPGGVIPTTMDGADHDLQCWVQKQRLVFRRNHFIEISRTERNSRNTSRDDLSEDDEEERRNRFLGTRQNHIDLIRRGLLTSIGFNWSGRDNETTVSTDGEADASDGRHTRNERPQPYDKEEYGQKLSNKRNDCTTTDDDDDDSNTMGDGAAGNTDGSVTSQRDNDDKDSVDDDDTLEWWERKEKSPCNGAVSWADRYKQLRAFLKERNISRITYPFYCTDRKLRGWVRSQRGMYKTGTMAPHRFELLDALGMPWDPDPADSVPKESIPYANEISKYQRSHAAKTDRNWTVKFKLLQSYLRKIKCSKIPFPFICPDRLLRSWIRTQRHIHKTGKMTTERFKLLNDLGMSWDIDGSIESLSPQHGGKRDTIGIGDANNRDRGDVEGGIEGSAKTLLTCPYSTLEEKDSDLIPYERKITEHERTHAANIERMWIKKYNVLLSYLRKNKCSKIPFPFNCFDKKLASERMLRSWLWTQRHVHKTGKMTPKRFKLLSDLGMPWEINGSVESPSPHYGGKDDPIDDNNNHDTGDVDVDGAIEGSTPTSLTSPHSTSEEEDNDVIPNGRKRRYDEVAVG